MWEVSQTGDDSIFARAHAQRRLRRVLLNILYNYIPILVVSSIYLASFPVK